MENIRNRVDVRSVNNGKAAEELAAKPNFKHLTILDKKSRHDSHEATEAGLRETCLLWNEYLGYQQNADGSLSL